MPRSCAACAKWKCARACPASCSKRMYHGRRARQGRRPAVPHRPRSVPGAGGARARGSGRPAGESAAGAARARPHRAAVRAEAREPARSRRRHCRVRECASAAVEAAEAALQRARSSICRTRMCARPSRGSPAAKCAPKAASSRRARIRACSRTSCRRTGSTLQFAMPQAEAEQPARCDQRQPDASSSRATVLDTQGSAARTSARSRVHRAAVGDQTRARSTCARSLDNTDGDLLPGQVVRARIDGVNLAGALVIPKRAIMHGMQGSFVWVIGAGRQSRSRARCSSASPRATTSR